MKLDRDTLEKRFHELTSKRDAIRAKADPLRAARDKAIKAADKKVRAANEKIAAAEKGLYDIDQERAMIARALGNRVGVPEAEA